MATARPAPPTLTMEQWSDIRGALDLGEWGQEKLAFLAVGACWLSFGSFAVPMKWERVQKADVHPLIYQCYKTWWTFVTSHLVLLMGQPFELSPWGLASGFSWVPAGVASVVAVQHIGIASGQALWQVTVIISSFVWGFAILKDETVATFWGTVCSVAALLLGIVGMGMTMAFGVKKKKTTPRRPSSVSTSRSQTPGGACSGSSAGGSSCEENGLCTDEQQSCKSVAIGVLAALFNGIWGGANLVPSHLCELKGTHFTLSFAYGALGANATLLVLYMLFCACCRRPCPSPQLCVMAVPGFISGSLWSLGNFFSLYVVNHLGQGIGYSLVQMSILVAGLWGILYYKELTGKQMLIWFLFVLIALGGVIGLAVEKTSKATTTTSTSR